MNIRQLIISTIKKSIPVMTIGILLFSCKGKEDDITKVNFDRKAMLENWADNIIIPAYSDFNTHLLAFRESVDSLVNEDSPAALNLSQQRFKELYLAFQRIKAFEVGPAADISFKAMMNTYPTDTSKIIANIQSMSYNLGSAANVDAKALPAIDFILYGHDQQVLQDEKMQQYLLDCTADMQALTTQIISAWQSYRNEFVNATGSDVGSSLGQIVNAINKDYELIKNAKVGFPAGKKTLGKTYPEAVEAYYSGISVSLAKENLQSIFNFYKGLNYQTGADKLGLEDYLKALPEDHNGKDLANAIEDQFQDAISAVEQIPAELSISVDDFPQAVDNAYLKIQKNVVLLKVDMPSALGVLITYQDNDGD